MLGDMDRLERRILLIVVLVLLSSLGCEALHDAAFLAPVEFASLAGKGRGGQACPLRMGPREKEQKHVGLPHQELNTKAEAAHDRTRVGRRVAIGTIVGVAVGLPMVSGPLWGSKDSHASTGKESAAKGPASFGQVMSKAASRAIGGGKSGAAAGVLQVLSLMWLRTTMNYQYRFGGSMGSVMDKLYQEGGVGRFYKGIGFALVQQPMSRFGDTAANTGMVVLLDSFAGTANLPVFLKTASASAAAAVWRIGLMPVDTFKTSLQVQGKEGLDLLKERIKKNGVGTLFEGSAATLGSTFVGHYPWFATFNTLQASIPPAGDSLLEKLVRNAAIGLCASAVSDCCSNSLRVLKTTKQTSLQPISYLEAAQTIVNEDGVQGLLGRGLKTRLITNGLQGMLFSVVWKLLDEYWK